MPKSEAPFECGGLRYRRCAVAVVFNQCGQVLLGERLRKPDNWQFPQGGVDRGETAADAAARELYEEVGIEGLELVLSLPEAEECCYRAGGWLKGAGFDGQVLLFSLFYLPGCPDPEQLCDLGGKGGEQPEFSAIKWASLEEAIDGVWGPKQQPYAYLHRLASDRMLEFLASHADSDEVGEHLQ